MVWFIASVKRVSPLSVHGNKRKLPLQADVRHSRLIPAMTVLLWWSRAIERRPKFAQGANDMYFYRCRCRCRNRGQIVCHI